MTTGNLNKKRHLDVQQREINCTTSVQKAAAASYLVRSHTKRNLLNQYNDESLAGFAKPNAKSLQQKRNFTANKKQGVNIFIYNIILFYIVKKI